MINHYGLLDPERGALTNPDSDVGRLSQQAFIIVGDRL